MLRQRAIRLILAAVLTWTAAHAPAGAEEPEEAPAAARAALLWQQGYILHMIEDYDNAIAFYRRSIELHPTAEAHTFLGWSLGALGRLDEAIAECRKAIPLDPDFGNPYNDIGVHLVDLGRPDEAIPWFEKAMAAKRYCCYQFPHFNIGRVLLEKGRVAEARRAFERALEYDPDYLPARLGLEHIREIERRTL